MSETIIQETIRIGGVPTDVTSVVFRDPTNTFGVRRTDNLATVVAAGVSFEHIGTGVYRYVITDPAENLTYNYWVEVTYAGETYAFEKDKSGTTGGGVAPDTIPDALERSCVSLARYAKIVGYSECAIHGVNMESEAHGDCENPIWSQFQRDTLLRYLAEAQADIEGILGYPLCPTYFTAEEHPYRFPVHTKHVKVIAAGVRAESNVLASAAVDYSVEPARIGPVATSVTDEDEIKVFYPGSEREIEAQRVVISGGTVTVWIPRCRLVAPDAFDTPQGGLDYDDLSNFLNVVDVRRVYTNNATNAQLVYPHRDSVTPCAACGCATCGEATTDACLYVLNSNTGALNALQATYSSGSWSATECRACHTSRPGKVRVNYLAGLTTRDLKLESAVIRLAHTKMPYSPCGCDPLKSSWERDNRIPEVLTRERENSPLGLQDGAWYAFQAALSKKSIRAGVL